MKVFHQLDGPTRFAGRGDAYARARPSYPPEAIAVIVREIGNARVADVGSGTGIGARLIADHGLEVTAIEPNRDMIFAAAPHPRVRFIEGVAEQLPLRNASIGAITAFTSFHWFKPDLFYAEVRRVTGMGGRLVVVWNDWDYRDAFTDDYAKLVRSGLTDYPGEALDSETAQLIASPVFARVERHEFANAHALDEETLVLRTKSISYVPHDGERWDAIRSGIEVLTARHGNRGIVTHRYITRVFIASVAR
jgi:SAM-dependent methyltransferase